MYTNKNETNTEMNSTNIPLGIVSSVANSAQPLRCLYYPTYIYSDAELARFLFVVPIWFLVALLGLIGNTLAYMVLRKELRPSSTSYLLKTLAVVDNLVLVTFTLDDSLVRIYVSTGTLESYYEFYMMAHPFIWPLKWFIKTLSVYTIILVTAERYVAVCKPLQAASFCTIKKARIAFLAVCLLSFLYNLPKCWQFETNYKLDVCTGRNRPYITKREMFTNDFFWSTIYGIALYIVVLFAVPFLVLTVLNVVLIRVIKDGAAGNLKFKGYTDKRMRYKKVITKRIVFIVTAFVILELPVFVMNVVKITVSGIDLSKYVRHLVYHLMQISYVISAMNSVVNFYVYFLTGSSFRHTLWKIMTGKRHVVRQSRTSPTSGSDNDLTHLTEVSALSTACVHVAQRRTTSSLPSSKRPCSFIKLDAVSDCI